MPPLLLAAADLATTLSPPWWATALLLLDWVIRLGTAVRVLMRRHDVELSLAWLLVVLVFPFGGAAVYWVFGEIRIGRRAAIRAVEPHADTERYLARLRERADASDRDDALDPRFTPLAVQAERATGVPALPGNRLRLLPKTSAAFRRLAGAIDRAHDRVEMVYYIFLDGPASLPVMDALVAAAGRGVTCRVLVDALGSRSFLKRSPQADRLRAAGVELVGALPSNPWRMLIRRIDLRNHRKLAVIDREIAFTGSMNLMGARRLKAAADVGPWIDVMVEVAGPAVGPLHAVFLEDWEAERQPLPPRLALPDPPRPRREPEPAESADRRLETSIAATVRGAAISSAGEAELGEVEGCARGTSWTQVVPSGPHMAGQSIRELLLTAVYAARDRVVLTSPYFVPDEAVLVALTSAAARGVDVTLVIPERLDSRLAQLAGEAHLAELIEANVAVFHHRGGLLHTKSVTVDGALSIVGTVNLDARSFYLNFELSLLVYDRGFTGELEALQKSYLDRSLPVSVEDLEEAAFSRRLARNTARLVGPLL